MLGGRQRQRAESAYGLMGLEGAEAGPVPAASAALTLNVYFRLGVRPVMVVNGRPLVEGVVRPRQAGQAGAVRSSGLRTEPPEDPRRREW